VYVDNLYYGAAIVLRQYHRHQALDAIRIEAAQTASLEPPPMYSSNPLINDLITGFLERQWNSEPMEKAWRLVTLAPEEIASLARAIMQEIPKGGQFLDATLMFLPESDWPRLVEAAVQHLRENIENEAAASVILNASLQCVQALHPFLPELFQMEERLQVDFGVFPWRESGDLYLEFLTRMLHVETASLSEMEAKEIRWRAFLALLETRRPEALVRAWEAVSAFGVTGEPRRWSLWEKDYERNESGFRLLVPATVRHLQFPKGYVERPQHLEDWTLPTWETLPSDAYRYRFGGVTENVCGLCGSPLCHLITLDPLLEGTGVTGVSKLSLVTCLSCIGYKAHWLFFLHDAEGAPTAYNLPEAPQPSEVSMPPLLEIQVAIVETLPRWQWQDWGRSDGRENLHRMGGHPCWIEPAEYPTCPVCARTMPFLMQLDTGLKTAEGWPLSWGDSGIAYLFWCDACRLSATMYQCA
jgi:hypothetical protein